MKAKIKALRAKQAQFQKEGDWSRATHCKIIADFLEDYVGDGAMLQKVVNS
jgi:hypothetical protein